MKILVPVKRVIDYNVRIRIKADGTGIETNGVKHSMNPFDEIAVEEAIRLKEKGIATEVVVVTLGEAVSQEVLRHALALGADRAILVNTTTKLEPLHAAKLLQAIVARETPDLIIMGKQAIDDDCNQTGQMLAALLGVGQATFASKVEIHGANVHVTREVDGGLQTLSLPMPCVITTDLRLNEPRYATLPNIMKAKSKPITIIAETELGVVHKPSIACLQVTEPRTRSAGIMVNSVQELVAKLKEVKAL